MAKIKQFEAFTKIFVAYKKNWVYSTSRMMSVSHSSLFRTMLSRVMLRGMERERCMRKGCRSECFVVYNQGIGFLKSINFRFLSSACFQDFLTVLT